MAQAAIDEDSATPGETTSTKRRRVYPRKSAVVLDAAERTFLEYGFASTSMDDIADAAGVSKRTVYSNFGSKEELFAEVIRKRCSAVPPADATIAKADSLDLEAGLRLIAVGFLKNVFARPQVELYQTVVAAARLRPEIGAIMFDGPILNTQHLIAGYLARRAAAGDIRVDDAEATAARLIALLKTNMHMRLLLNQPAKLSAKALEESAAESVRLFLYGALPR